MLVVSVLSGKNGFIALKALLPSFSVLHYQVILTDLIWTHVKLMIIANSASLGKRNYGEAVSDFHN